MAEWVWFRPSWHRLTGRVEDDGKLEADCGVRVPPEAAHRPDPDPPVQDRCPTCDGQEVAAEP